MTDIVATAKELETARGGIYFQLRNTTKIPEVYSSLAQGIIELGLADFIENQAKVLAQSQAWQREANKLMRDYEERLRNGG